MSLNTLSPATFTTGVLVGDTKLTPNAGSDSIPLMTKNANGTVSASLEVQSTTGALLISRMTTAQRDADSFNPTEGMLIYNRDLDVAQIYQNGAWVSIGNGNGNVIGPNASILNDIAVFADNTGTVLADSGVNVNTLGDVFGPEDSILGNFASFSDITGKNIQDSGVNAADFGDVSGPNVSVGNNIATFNGTTGKIIQDSGVAVNLVPVPAPLSRNRALSNVIQISNIGQIQFVNDLGLIFVDGLMPVEFITNDYGPESQVCTLFTGGLPSSSTNPSALVEIQSTTGAFVVSRMTTTERNALTPTTGMILFNTDTNLFELYQGASWVSVNTGAGGGDMSGPGSSINNSISVFNGTSGTLLKDTTVLIDSSANITDINNLSTKSLVVGNNTGTPTNVSTILDIQSTTGALAVSRMTTAQRDALTPIDGMIIYNSDVDQFVVYQNSSWQILPVGAGGGDVFGPGSSVENTVVVFDDTTGKVISDSGILQSALVLTNPVGTSTPLNLPYYLDAFGRLIGDSGISSLSVVRGPISSTVGDIPIFSNTSGNGLSDSGVQISQNPSLFDNLFIGVNAGNSIAGGSSNLGVGINTLNNLSLGDSNVALGFSALNTLLTGDNNTALGSAALLALISGNENVALGSGSSSELVDGSHNVSVGSNSLQNNINGSDSVAVGHSALLSNISDGNTAVGHQSAQMNSSGTGIVALGYQSSFSNVSGDSITAIGSLALYNNKSDNNTAVGASAGYLLEDGSNNTCIGVNALSENVSGSNSVAVGYLSQESSTSSDNTSVGAMSLQNNTSGTDNCAFGLNSQKNGTIASGNTSVGSNSLLNNIEGISNTAIGATALSSNLSSYNTAVGAGALQDNDESEKNCAFGYESLFSQTTSTPSNNSAFGYKSATANTIGRGLSSFGSNSLLNNEEGDFNSSFGYLSQVENINGNNNSSFGYNTLNLNTASGNTAIGAGSMSFSTTGENNTAVGILSLSSNETGESNCAFGENALFGNDSGSNCIGIGSNALGGNVSGNNSVSIGSNSGFSQSVYNSCTFLGYSADATANSLTNAGAIGANAKINVSNALNIGNNCLIGFNQTNPLYSLHISNAQNQAAIYMENSSGIPPIPAPSAGGFMCILSDDLFYFNDANPGGINLTESFPTNIQGTLGEIDVSYASHTYTISIDGAYSAAITAEIDASASALTAAYTAAIASAVAALQSQIDTLQAQVLVIEGEIAAFAAFEAYVYAGNYVTTSANLLYPLSQNLNDFPTGLVKTTRGIDTCTLSTIQPVDPSSFVGEYYAPGYPTYLIDTSAAGTYNLFYGSSCGNTSLSGSHNMGLGISAMTNLNSGSRNIGLGYLTLRNCENANDNISIGHGTLENFNKDEGNIAIGTYALNALQEGLSNVSIGLRANSQFKAGSGTISIGLDSLYNNIGSGNNSVGQTVSVGVQSLFSHTNSIEDVAIGYNAGYYTVASPNIFIGAHAGQGNVNGTNNTFIGTNVFAGSTSGNQNVAIGDSSFLTGGGSDNVFVGAASGVTQDDYDKCILIGSFADTSVNNLTNAIAIGYGAQVGLSNSIVLGDGCNVGIRTSTPQAALSVLGGQIVKRTATATNYTVLNTDYIIGVTSTAAPRTITLPAATTTNTGQVFYVKDESGGAATNSITVNAASGSLIDGASSILINQNYGLLMFYSSGTAWFVG